MLIFAASTQRTIGLVIAIVVSLFFLGYVLFNVFSSGRDEIGSEVELAPNRKPYFDDEDLETKRLDLSLAAGVGTLAIIALALPLYWLGEPGRQEGRDDFTVGQFERRGEGLYEELCAQCHGAGAVGGGAGYTVLDDEGRFIAAVNWQAPALNNILYRFSEEEVTHILNYGRPQSPMPAWGAPGGGPLTAQQLEEIIEYLRTVQLTPEQMQDEVLQGVRDAVRDEAIAADSTDFDALTAAQDAGDVDAINGAQDDFNAYLDGYIDSLAQERLGEILYDNTAGAGAYGCARCHTAGWSWDADGALAANPALEGLVEPEVAGGGGFGPGLLGVESQFADAESQSAFISVGCSANLQYGTNGVCEPSGQMPGFGPGASDYAASAGGGMLTPEQIDAIVAYERGLD